MMTRRDAIRQASTFLAGAGIAGEVKAIDDEPKPILLAITIPHRLSSSEKHSWIMSWAHFAKDKDLPPMVILDDGQDIKAITDSRGGPS